MNALKFHQATDFLLAQALRQNSIKTCCDACLYSYCCSEPAYADIAEVELMLGSLTEEERERVAEHAREWLAKVQDSPLLEDNLPQALPWRLLNASCPFLENGRCMAYQHRPMGCRTWLAKSNPENCAMPARKHQKFLGFGANFHEYLHQLCPPDGVINMDHIGIHLVNLLLGKSLTSGSVKAMTFI